MRVVGLATGSGDTISVVGLTLSQDHILLPIKLPSNKIHPRKYLTLKHLQVTSSAAALNL